MAGHVSVPLVLTTIQCNVESEKEQVGKNTVSGGRRHFLEYS